MMKIIIKGYFLEVDVEYPKNLFNFHSALSFLTGRNKIKKCNKLICDIHAKKNNVVHIKILKQELNQGLILKKLHRVIQFNQKAWLKPYIDRIPNQKQKQKMILKKISLN